MTDEEMATLHKLAKSMLVMSSPPDVYALAKGALELCQMPRHNDEEYWKLRKHIRQLRKALRELNKSHKMLWQMVGYRNEFHGYAVKKGIFVEFRKDTEK